MTPQAQQIIVMTPEQLKEYSFSIIEEYEKRRAEQAPPTPQCDPNEERYGIRGIRDIFNVSHKQACLYKKTFLMPGGATIQRGRKIITNVARAKQLFAEHKQQQH